MYLKNARIVKLFISLLFFLAEIKKQWTLAILPVFIEIRLRGIFSEKKKRDYMECCIGKNNNNNKKENHVIKIILSK